MKHIYSNLWKHTRTLSLIGLLSLSSASFAQNSTFIYPSQNCGEVIENFDEGPGGYTSSSLHSDSDDSAFYYKKSLGFWTEKGEDGVTRFNPIVPRRVSILSTVYDSPKQAGFFDVGFVYVVPNASVDRFRIRLVRVNTDLGVSGLISTMGFATFEEYKFGTIQPYSDTAGHVGQRGSVCLRITDADIIVGDNIKYRVEVTYEIFSQNAANQKNYTIFDEVSLNNTSQGGTLPVSFMGIVAKKNSEGGVQVKWDVADEINVKEYLVERSADGKSFSVIGTVPASGKMLYSFVDGNPISGTAYYRVKNVDNDRKSKYSGIIKLNGSSNSSYGTTMRAYPTPAQEQVTIEHRKLTKDAKITISTVDGRTLKTVIPANGASHTPINLNGMPKGVYIVRLEDGQNAPETSKLIKQ